MANVLFLFFTDGAAYHHGLALLSGALEAEGVSTALHVVDLRQIPKARNAQLRAALERESPGIVAVSAMGCHWPGIRGILDANRKVMDATVLVGGWHATLAPEEVLSHEGVDYVCVGEGELPMVDFARDILAGGDASDIPNIWRMEDGSIIKTPLRPPVADLDSLPLPNRDIYPYPELLDAGLMGTLGPVGPPRVAPLMAGRGCVYNCSYCCNASWRDRYGLPAKVLVRRRSVSRVLEEVTELLERYDPSWLEFWDEDFAVDGKWLREFAAAYPTVSSVPFNMLARPNNVQGREFEMLAEAGCRLVMMGIESGDETFRREVLQRRMTDDQILDAFRLARENGIATVGFNMIGMPFETAQNVEATIDLCSRVRADFHIWFVYIPFQGSRLYRQARDAGILRTVDALNYRSDTPNVKGIPDDVFALLRDRMARLEQELDGEREARYPGRFGPVALAHELRKRGRPVELGES